MDKPNVVYAYDGILFSFKRKEVLTHALMGMKPEDLMLSQISQLQADKYCVIPLLTEESNF